jgi:hypothetical protein
MVVQLEVEINELAGRRLWSREGLRIGRRRQERVIQMCDAKSKALLLLLLLR